VRFLGFTPHVRDVLAAGDLLVSPVRYEAYGLNVHEALCRGLAVMVTETAGVVERFDSTMSPALLPQGVTADGLADRLRAWRADVEGWRSRAAATAARLRARSWTAMAAELIAVVQESTSRAASA
jgi:glycosyltransferase involved in cell wall biosynthesis